MKVCSMDYIRLKMLHKECVLDTISDYCTFAGVASKKRCKYWVDKQTVRVKDGDEYCKCCGQSLKGDEK